jgi:photosystem II stability/assembly factor-like uncharacterized protein
MPMPRPRALVRTSLVTAMAVSTAGATAAPPRPAPGAPPADPRVNGLVWRHIGPFRGGRSVAVAGVSGQPLVYYFGGTGGGVFKTTDAGSTWKPVTDGQLGTGSVGAIAVAESDPNVVYVGMGESCIRGNVSHGDGVYKSVDAGRTWTHAGLRDTRQIGRVRVHPRDADLVYVAALGHAFGPNQERGVFRSKDGGATWQKVLFVDERTGAVDLALDPTNPRVLYAGFWQVVRLPWGFESGGPGSALYKSTDGGDTWQKLEGDGLPEKGVWGRIGVAVSPARPDRVWAMIEAEDGGLFRSDDAGRTWRRVNQERRLRQRAWYYTHVYADPHSADAVYVLNVAFFRSLDGGRTFTTVEVPHGDNHDLWIAPEDPRRMINANDGGANVSLDGGASWSRQDNQPTAQFYHVVTDDRFPYRVYGAQQDNTTVSIASRNREAGIGAADFHEVGGCESGYIAPRPDDPDVVYAGCYGGYISRYDHRTGEVRNVTVHPDNPMGHGAEGMKYRFQWTFPIVASPHDPDVVYAAGNVVFRSTSGGQGWQAISPDLTRNDPTKLGPSGGPITRDNTSVEYYGTVFAFAESPVQKGLLWAGSDDGLVHVSRDGGQTWSNVTPKGLPEWSMVSQIDPSPHDAGTMFLAVNRYKHDDFRPFAYVTRDHGQTWTKITEGLPGDAFVRVVRQDPVRPDLLYAGTETGVYVSLDGGARWQPLAMDLPGETGEAAGATAGRLPVVPITDLVVKGNDVVAATQGRSFWILDDVSPLRQGAAGAATRLFAPAPAVRFFAGGRPESGLGQNPPSGAAVYYSLARAPKEDEEVTLEFLDAQGTVLRRLSSRPKPDPAAAADDEEGGPPRAPQKLPAKAGLNRAVWDLRGEEASRFQGLILWSGELRGPIVPPGRYGVRLTAAGETLTQTLEVRKDPRLATSDADFAKQYDLRRRIRDKLTETHDAIVRIRDARDQVRSAAERAKAASGGGAVAAAAEALDQKLTAVEEALYQTKNQSSQDPLNFPIRLNNKLAALARVVDSADAAPTDQSYVVHDDLAGRIDAELARLRQALSTDLESFNRLVREQDVPAVVIKGAR